MTAKRLNGSPRVPKRTLASVITSQVRRRIIDGTYPPGMQLNEVDLAGQFATSRGPVREGLQRLVQEGLLVSEPHRGMFVPVLTDEDIEDIYHARSAIERSSMMRLIDRGLTAATLAELEQVLDEMKLAIKEEDWFAVAAADLRFHEVIVTAAGSPRLLRMYTSLAGETRLGINRLVRSYEGRRNYLEEHQRIFSLLAAQDRKGLIDELEAHLGGALSTLQQHHPEAPDQQEPGDDRQSGATPVPAVRPGRTDEASAEVGHRD